VKFGDKNIKYFHIVASHQKRNNTIAAIQRGDQTFSDHGTKTSILFLYFCSLIGTSEEPMINFNFSRTYGRQQQFLDQQNWEAIQASISEEEIKATIDAWAHNKSAGPDGFPAEFYQIFKDLITPDLASTLTITASTPEMTLGPLNGSYIVLIPKKVHS
jgi:hypothetical protein